MSIPDPRDAAAAPADVPDAGLIAQMANAFFQALPSSSTPPLGTGAALPSAPVAGALPPPITAPALSPLPLATPTATSPSQEIPSGGGAAMPSVPGAVVAPNRSQVAGEAPNLVAAPPAAPVSASAAQVPLVGHGGFPNEGRTVGATDPGYDFAGLASDFDHPLARLPQGLDRSLTGPAVGLAPAPAGDAYWLEPAAVPAPVAPTAAAIPAAPATPTAAPAGSVAGRDTFADALARRPDLLILRPELVPDLGLAAKPFDPRSVKNDFPILSEEVHGRKIVWLDNGATTQKPKAVIDRLSYFYEHENSNVHRGAHTLAARATDAYEAAREKVARFLGAGSTKEIVFVRGATEGINLIAKSWGKANVREGDEIVVTHLEHHANIVPWQQLAAEVGARLRVVPVDDRGQVILEAYEKLLGPKTKIVSMTHVSNALGTVVPVAEMVAAAHARGICTLVDGAQSVSHMPVNVQAIGCDFFVLSGHKMFAPTGIGVVYGRKAVLDATPPWQGGGNMIADVTFEKTVYQGAPERFEAGTGNIADAVGLGAAIDYLERIGMPAIAAYEHELLAYATRALTAVPGLTLWGTAAEKAGVLSFTLEGKKTQEMGAALDRHGIAVRSGHHCAQPILRRFGLEATIRASLAFYNTCEDIDALVAALRHIQSGRA
jgi:cysteine desulfurase/selenocysteine lyase